MIIDMAEENILIAESMSERLRILEAQRLMAERRQFLIEPRINLMRPQGGNRRKTRTRKPEYLDQIIDD